MMADLTPDERAALLAAVNAAYETNWADVEPCDVAIWRAARAYQAEQDARVCERLAGANTGLRVPDFVCGTEAESCADEIRERAKGLT
jgi:hypothetical protein